MTRSSPAGREISPAAVIRYLVGWRRTAALLVKSLGSFPGLLNDNCFQPRQLQTKISLEILSKVGEVAQPISFFFRLGASSMFLTLRAQRSRDSRLETASKYRATALLDY